MYDGLSDFYDVFMQEVDYSAWCDFATRFLGDRKNGVDVGCGSGKFTLELLKRGYSVVGLDSSAKMIAKAYENAQKIGVFAEFAVMDAEKIRLAQKKEFVTAICDVVNYLKKPERFFSVAYNNLVDGGVLFFDVSTDYKLKKILGNNTFSDETDDALYVWNNYLFPKRVDMELAFFRRDEDGRYTRFNEIQTQYIHTVDELISALKNVGFSSVEVYSDYECNPIKKNSERAYIIAKKGN